MSVALLGRGCFTKDGLKLRCGGIQTRVMLERERDLEGSIWIYFFQCWCSDFLEKFNDEGCNS